MEKKKYYITTAIDYTNAKPHLGHALEKVQADVLARYHREKGFDVFFLTGTDEHGVKVLRTMKDWGVSREPQQFVDELSGSFKALKEAFDLSWDDFIRTTDRERHWPGVELIWKKLVEAGDIYKKKYQGLYCVGCERFVTARDLEDGKCSIHKKEPEKVEEENYFFRLSKYSKEIESRIRNNELSIIPEARANEILALIGEGLEDVSFSRPSKDLPWGIPVPGDETQTMYVWADALTNYISAIGYGRNDDWKRWWPADAQVVGKDILRFHACIWPGMLLAAGLPLPRNLLVHGFITVNGLKMSKSIGNVVDPAGLVKKYGTDAVRYYLLKEIPSHEDGDFNVANFERVYNGELANGLGNFTSRILGLVSRLEIFKVDLSSIDHVIQAKIESTKKKVDEKIHAFKLHEAIGAINELIAFGDKYINDNEVWKETGSKRKEVLNLVVILDNVADLLVSFLPGTADEIKQDIKRLKDGDVEFGKRKSLFPRLN